MNATAEIVANRLFASKRLSLASAPVTIKVDADGTDVVVVVDSPWTGPMTGVAQDIKTAVRGWSEASGPIVIRWADGGKLGVYFTYSA